MNARKVLWALFLVLLLCLIVGWTSRDVLAAGGLPTEPGTVPSYPEVLGAPLLQAESVISKTAPSELTAGDPLPYEIIVSNDDGVVNEVVTDTVPANTRYVADSMHYSPPEAVVAFDPPSPPDAGSLMSWTIASPASPVTLTFNVAPILPITNGTVVANQAWLSGANDSATTTILSVPDLHVSKIVTPTTVLVGGPVTYTISLVNSGTGIAEGVIVTDRLPADAAFIGTVQGESPSTTNPELRWNDLTVVSNHVLQFVVSAPSAPGTYSNQAAAILGGDRVETGLVAPVDVTLSDSTTSLTSHPNPSTYGGSVTLTATVSSGVDTPTGVVTFTLDSTTVTAPLNGSGVATYSTSSLSVGNHSVQAAYGGDVTHSGSASTIVTQVVNRAGSDIVLNSGPNPSTYGANVTLTATVTGGVGTPTGVVTFTLDSATVTASLSDGVATYVTSTLSVGNHSLRATYGGDTTHSGSTSTVTTQVVNPGGSGTALDSTPNPSTYAGLVTLTATVTGGVGTPTGVVTFTLDSATVTATLNGSGVATYVTSTLSVGNHSLRATYGGDPTHAGSTSTVITQKVNPLSSTTILNSGPNPSTYGSTVALTATVSSAVGTPSSVVTFTLDSAVVHATLNDSGVATYVTTTLSVGSHSLRATYGGDTTHAGSTSTAVTQKVNLLSSTTILNSGPNPSTYGGNVTLTATVSSGVVTPSGVVTFTLDSATVTAALNGSGVATYATSSLSVGNHSLRATYGGDDTHAGSTSTIVTQAVNPVGSATALITGPNPSTFGDSVTLTATVTSGLGTPSGVVTFTLDSATVTATLNGSGVATYVTSTLSVGNHSLRATYGGDITHSSSTSTVATQVVNQGDSVTALDSNPNPSTYGSTVTLTATVSGGVGTPTGVVTFTLDSAVVHATLNDSGVATYVTSTLSVGNHSLQAAYGGDATHSGSASTVVTQVVNRGGSGTALNSNPNPSTYGGNVTLTATVTGGVGTPTGVVTFTLDSAVVHAALNGSGVATYVTSTLSVGNHSLQAAYGGDTTHSGSASTVVTQVVNRSTTATALTSAPNPSILTHNVTLNATVTGGVGTPTGVVTFTLDSARVTTALNGSGVASYVTSTLTIGDHSLQAAYGGDGTHSGSTSPARTQKVLTNIRQTYLPMCTRNCEQMDYHNYTCTPDPYDVPCGNNSPDSASPLSGSTTLSANFCGPDQKDEFRITVTDTGTPIRLNLTQVPSGCDYDLYLGDMADLRDWLATSKRGTGQDENIQLSPPHTGEYLILVNAYSKSSLAGTDSYRLQVSFK